MNAWLVEDPKPAPKKRGNQWTILVREGALKGRAEDQETKACSAGASNVNKREAGGCEIMCRNEMISACQLESARLEQRLFSCPKPLPPCQLPEAHRSHEPSRRRELAAGKYSSPGRRLTLRQSRSQRAAVSRSQCHATAPRGATIPGSPPAWSS